MVNKIVFTFLALAAISLSFTPKQNEAKNDGFAVVELFTSEGCSSCPPADELVAKVEQENKEKPVYILAYHVDYWDRLGWKDSFSSPQYSKRQNQYANWLHLSSVYTPQIVVNGREEFIGSEEKTLRTAIRSALAQTPRLHLAISIEKQTDANIALNYRTSQAVNGENLIIAIVNPAATNKIERGENRGKTLNHVQIVRNFETFNINGKQNGTVDLPLANQKQNFELIALLQNANTGKITAAAKLPVKI